MRRGSCYPGRWSRLCCRVRVVRRPVLRDGCPSPAAPVICRQVVTAPAPARIRLPVGILVGSVAAVDVSVVADTVGSDAGPGTAGGDGVHQVDSAVAVEHDRFTGLGIDSHDEHRPSRPALTGQPGGDGSAPLPLPRAARCRIHFERRRAHFAAHVGRILSSGDDFARLLQKVRQRHIRDTSTVGSAGPVPGWGTAARMLASSSAGWVALLIWAAAVDPADVPMIRSASVTSNPASNRPAMTPISHAFSAPPPPPRTNARSPAAPERLDASTCCFFCLPSAFSLPLLFYRATINPSPYPSPSTARFPFTLAL